MVVTGRVRRTQPCPWNSFLWPEKDFWDEQCCSYGLLSVGIGLCTFGHGRQVEDDAWRPIIGPFKPRTRFFNFWQWFLFFYIIYVLHYNNKDNKVSQWWPHRRLDTQRLEVRGFDPCLQQFAFSKFLAGNQVHAWVWELSCSLRHPMARWPKAKSESPRLRVHHRPGPCTPTGFQKSTKGQLQLGFRLLITPQMQAQTPHSFYFIYFVLLFVFIIFI